MLFYIVSIFIYDYKISNFYPNISEHSFSSVFIETSFSHCLLITDDSQKPIIKLYLLMFSVNILHIYFQLFVFSLAYIITIINTKF